MKNVRTVVLLGVAVMLALSMLACGISLPDRGEVEDALEDLEDVATQVADELEDVQDSADDGDTSGDDDAPSDGDSAGDDDSSSGDAASDGDGDVISPDVTLVQMGDALTIDNVSTPEGGVNGEIMAVEVTNTGSEAQVIIIPCGTIFIPGGEGGEDEQRMMTVQQASAEVPPGETVVLNVFVVCIDAEAGPASGGRLYSVGDPASGDLLALAQCVCLTPLDPEMSVFGVQFAAWMISDGVSYADVGEELQGAASEFSEAEIPPEIQEQLEALGMGDMEEMLAQMMEAMGMMSGTGQEWLDRCGIDLGE